jgi:hypothetical protein
MRTSDDGRVLNETPPQERQDTASVREAARVCLAEHAPVFALALVAIAVRRSSATAEDWVLAARALLDPEPEERLEDAMAIVKLCLQRARTDAPGHAEIERLCAEVAARRSDPLAAEEIVVRIFDALESVPVAPAHAFLELPPDTQDVVVTELVDEAEARMATLVASILRTGVNPALHCALLDCITAWAAHPDIRDAVEDLAGSERRELVEPLVSEALHAVERARSASLHHHPSEGRPAPRRPRPARRAGEPGAEKTGTVFSATAQRSVNMLPLGAVGTLAALALCVFVATLNDWRVHRGPGLPVAVSAGAAVALGLVLLIWARAARVYYRIVVTGDGARFEIDDGARSKSIPFPLDYRAAVEHGRMRIRGITRDIFSLRLVILEEGSSAVVLVEHADGPPRGWSQDMTDMPPGPTYVGTHLDPLEREITRWNRAERGPGSTTSRGNTSANGGS